jgi:hypothetical protein
MLHCKISRGVVRYLGCTGLVSLLLGFCTLRAIAAGHWVPLASKSPIPAKFRGIGRKLLLSDGTVMAQACTNATSCGTLWFRLTPDAHGSYVNGTWTSLAPMHFERANYPSCVLQDGRVFVIGGEQTNNISGGQGDIYDPTNDTWTLTAAIPTTLFTGTAQVEDSQSMVLSNGKVLIAPVRVTGTNDTLLYDPKSNTWAAGASFLPRRNQNEASWVKLPDDSIVEPDNDNIHAERYIPASNQWIDAAPIPASMQLYAASEMGPGLLLPNGQAAFFGGTGHVALYAPPSSGQGQGSWTAGPDIPSGRSASDDPAAMMVNGKILIAVGATSRDGGSPPPTWFYEYDYSSGTNGSFAATSSPGNATVGSQTEASAGDYTFLALPDGTILSSQGADPSGQLYVYVPDSPALASGKPTVASIGPNSDGQYHLSGTLLNGISEGAAFGDDAQMSSNYPLVRLTDHSGKVTYTRTYNWSSTGVMTGNKPVSTEFALPLDVAQATPGGKKYSLVVVANGISSNPVDFVAPLHFNMERWTGAWGSDGPIFTGDLNGDHKTDVFMWRDSDKSWTVNLSTGSGFIQQKWTGGWGSDGPIFTGDLNGDHKTDVFMWRDSDKSWTVNLSTGSGFTQQKWTGGWGSDGPIFTGDLNGDGKTDVFMWRDSDKSWTVNLSTGSGFTQEKWTGGWGSDGPVFTGDLNGDGKTDVFMWRDSDKSWTVNLSTGSGFTQQRWIGGWGSDGPILTSDLNGDHKTDVFMWRDSDKSWIVNLSTGSGFTQQKWTGAWGSDGPIFTGELNGGHKGDVFMWREAFKDWTINLSTGSGFTQQSWKGAWGSDGPIFTGDLNGDGKTDVFMWRDSDKSWTVNLTP